jgi:hypothetical protein
MLACRIVGHRYHFEADGRILRWTCRRGCGAGGERFYATPADARRYAGAFSREDRENIGRRAPLIGLLPLRIWRALRR